MRRGDILPCRGSNRHRLRSPLRRLPPRRLPPTRSPDNFTAGRLARVSRARAGWSCCGSVIPTIASRSRERAAEPCAARLPCARSPNDLLRPARHLELGLRRKCPDHVGVASARLKIGGILYISYNSRTPDFRQACGICLLIRRGGDRPRRLTPRRWRAVSTALRRQAARRGGRTRDRTATIAFEPRLQPCRSRKSAKRLEPAKLTFAGSANYLDHIEGLNLMPEHAGFWLGIPDPFPAARWSSSPTVNAGEY